MGEMELEERQPFSMRIKALQDLRGQLERSQATLTAL
jgi:hypothetical protein